MDKAPQIGIDHWHKRFVQQAVWTHQVREYLAGEIGFSRAARILEVGCGTGVITHDLRKQSTARVHGLDISPVFLKKADQYDAKTTFTCGDAFHLPFAGQTFDHCMCHFLLLWLDNPMQALKEMLRITRSGGSIIIFAEPDYAARIDFPAPLENLGKLQAAALTAQGANPNIGRSAAHILVQAGCNDVHSGLMGGQWSSQTNQGSIESEQQMLKSDLVGLIPENQLDSLLSLDRKAWQEGVRVLFVPTFFAWGRVP